MSARINHASCSHPSTKVARAKCRRDLARAAASLVTVATVVAEPATVEILTKWYEMKSGPLELTAAPVVTPVTRENWREYKGELVTLSIIDGSTMKVMITGWSANLIQYKVDGAGKLTRMPVERIESVTA